MSFQDAVVAAKALVVEQRHELAELVGFETRNKYQILGEDGTPVGYCAEQDKGFIGFLARQFLGHWRVYDLFFFDMERRAVLLAHHPFRFFFQRLEIATTDGRRLGALQLRFSLLSKKFDVEGPDGRVVMTVSSPLWKLWTFPFEKEGRPVAVVLKKWAGLLSEAFTDKDRFRVEFSEMDLSLEERLLVLAAALFVDLQYFERKAR